MKQVYKLKLTGGESIILTQEDFEKVKANMGKKAFVQVSGAIFNTAYIVSITPEKVEQKTVLEGYIDEEKKVFRLTRESKVDKVGDLLKLN